MTLCVLHFAVVSDTLDLSSTEWRLNKEKDNFSCVNKSMYVTSTVCENCATLIFFHKTLDLSLLHARCFRGALYAVLGEMEIISRVELFDCVIAYF